MTRFRLYILGSGVLGLLAGAALIALSFWLVHSKPILPLLPFPTVALLFGLTFAAFSLVEMPMMIYTMRRLVIERQKNRTVVVFLNALYVFFAAVYAAPVIVLTGSLGWGLFLAILSLARFVSSLLFIHE